MRREGAKLLPQTLSRANKWVLLAPELFRAPGGIARVSRHYLQAMADARENRDLTVLVLNDEILPSADLAICRAEGLEAVGCNRSKLRCATNLWRMTSGEAVHVTCTHVKMSPLVRLLKRIRPTLTYDVVVHGIEVWRDLPASEQSALRGARLIFSVSDYTRRELVTRYPEFGARTHVLPNALDPGFEQGAPDDITVVPNRILAVSRLAEHDWEKGIDHVIEAMAAVRKTVPDAHLHVVGDGVDRARLEGIAAELTEPDCVSFRGRVTDTALGKELAACQLFALPSRKEGFGLVYLEAMAAGKPCIVANAGGAPEVVDSQSGIVVPYGEVTLLAETIKEALRHPWDAAKVRARAQRFSFPAFVDRWRSLSLSYE